VAVYSELSNELLGSKQGWEYLDQLIEVISL
jgi:hypothetical protein